MAAAAAIIASRALPPADRIAAPASAAARWGAVTIPRSATTVSTIGVAPSAAIFPLPETTPLRGVFQALPAAHGLAHQPRLWPSCHADQPSSRYLAPAPSDRRRFDARVFSTFLCRRRRKLLIVKGDHLTSRVPKFARACGRNSVRGRTT